MESAARATSPILAVLLGSSPSRISSSMTKSVAIRNPEVARRGKLTTAEEFSLATKPGPGEKTEISF